MIHPTRTQRAADLLKAGHTQREVARRTQISRGTIGAIASGRRPVILQPRQPQQADDDTAERPSGPIEQCPGCGRQIEMPCRACVAEGRRRVRRVEPRRLEFSKLEAGPIGIELRDEGERERYRDVHADKLRQGQDELASCFGVGPSDEPEWEQIPPGDEQIWTCCPQCDRTVLAVICRGAEPEVALWQHRNGEWVKVDEKCTHCGHYFGKLKSGDSLKELLGK